MSIVPSGPPVVKEFRFYPESNIVTVVFLDDKTEDFMGPENYRLARAAAGSSELPSADLGLTDRDGDSVIMIVNKGTPVETFDA